MEIIRYKKIKNNIYEITLKDNNKIKLYDNTILKYNLLTNKKIDTKTYQEIINYNNTQEAYYQSIKYLTTKLRCETEIRKYLTKKEYTPEIINNTITKLKKENYINDETYLKSYINDKINLTLDGPNKIKTNLLSLGFKEEEINKYLNIDNKERIIKIINKKLKQNTKYNTNKLKQNIYTYLITQGYPKEEFITYINDIKIDDNKYLEKDLNKLITKYQNKYKDKETLKYIIKNKLYQKGYKQENIGEIINEKLL